MATKFINSTETNSLSLQQYKKKPKINPTLKSFWAFLFSLFLYVSVFYAFNLSTSTLVCSTKFWFFISNTLIFIIAVDFGAFSSPKEADDFYEEYDRYSNAMRTTDRVPFPFQPLHPKNVGITTANYQKEEEYKKPQEKIINMISSSTTKNDYRTGNHKPEEKKPDITFVEEKNANSVNLSENFERKKQDQIIIPKVKNEAHAVKKRPKATTFRSNSTIIPKIDDKLVAKRTLSMGHDEPARSEENDEYSMMSDEELNRRVEEFIRRFNRQIRLQASKSRQSFGASHDTNPGTSHAL